MTDEIKNNDPNESINTDKPHNVSEKDSKMPVAYKKLPAIKNVWVIGLTVLLVLSIIGVFFVIAQQQAEENEILAGQFGTGDAIGVVNIYGVITYDMVDPVIDALNQYHESEAVKGIIIRINSPGGEVGSTQEIYNKILDIREGDNPKHVYASIGNMCASGGYYIACACEKLFTNSGSMVGSIGVIMSRLSIKGLLDEYGVKNIVIKGGRFKDSMSIYNDIDEEELQQLQMIVDDTYAEFKRIVLNARQGIMDLDQDKLEQYAQGQVFSGNIALSYGLVDELGTFEKTVEAMKTELNLTDQEINIIKPKQNPFENLFDFFDPTQSADTLLEFILMNQVSSPILYLYIGGI